MRVPISWLKDYVDISLPIPELAEKLTMAGLEVEKIEYIGLPGSELPWDADKIFVAQVLGVERHPNADKLLLVDLDYGNRRQIKVVTGAPNLKPGDVGQKVVLALKGSRLYDGHKAGKVITVLKEAMLRGIKNDSMVCSEKELGISDEHDGIIILPADAPVGAPLADYWGDAVLDVAILPNTARCAGMVGIAREVAALTGATLRYPPMNYTENDTAHTANLVRLEIRDCRLNPRFTAGLIRNIKQGPSPAWMQRRLKLCGMRAIGNVVDVSNYVMMEWGHPTHTFDYDRIRGAATASAAAPKLIYTRTAQTGEQLTTLDGTTRELLPTDILVCDAQGATSLAGVMGGAVSEVADDTVNVLFEVASWNNIAIRRTARHHDLHSEASFRFSRGLHPAQAMLAQKRGLFLLQQLTGGTITHGVMDAYPEPMQLTSIELDPSYVTRTVGMDIAVDEMVRILRALEFVVEKVDQAEKVEQPPILKVIVPDHRLDIEGQHDLAEEIGRVYGYDKLPATLMDDALPSAYVNKQLSFEERVKDILANAGLSEIVSYRMTTPEAEAKLLAPGTPKDDRPYVGLLNPINPERTVMRHTLLGNVLESLALNMRHHKQVKLFEVGHVYLPSEEGGGALPDEQPRLCIALCGAQDQSTWQRKATANSSLNFFDAKGVVDDLLGGLKIDEVVYESVQHPTFFPGRTARISTAGKNGQQIGIVGELHPQVREALGLPDQPVVVVDLDVAVLRATAEARTSYLIADVPRFPSVEEDLAVIVNEDVAASAVAQAIQRAGGHLLSSVHLFDVYRGEQVGTGKKSLAYALTYQATDRTLDERDVEKLRAKIIRTLEATLGAMIRR
jgi:phenylalanyl-tRNA synthetase beta chain